MILIPAIDIKDGKVVRLFQGKFSDVTEYGDDPLTMALQWQTLGAKWLHVVDLDGAKDGVMKNKDVIFRIAQTLKIPVEVGGGIRNKAIVDELINVGKVSRVILGTKAIEHDGFLSDLIQNYKEKICVSLDCFNGLVAARGWTETSSVKATDLAARLEKMGLEWMVYTDIARDGALTGPNFEQLETMVKAVTKINIIASGGVSNIDDVYRLSQMKGIAAAITGKAIYEGKLDFSAALKIC